MELPERFWSKVDKTDTCWLWTGFTDKYGYGKARLPRIKQMTSAHRVAYELAVGVVPDGMTLDHLCRVHRCVNPKHLEPVSIRTNVLRGIGPSARNAKKTHCIRGHEFTEANTYTETGPTGYKFRKCLQCHALKTARQYQRKKTALRERLVAEGLV